MKSAPRVRANRRNARSSTGPRTAEGKARSAKNSLRHGLNVPVALDPALSDEVARLGASIAGQGADELRLQAARRIAEAQIDIIRIRRIRLEILTDPAARMPLLTWREVRQRVKELKNLPDPEVAFERMERLIETRRLEGPEPSLEEGLNVLALQLLKLDRYERRALSRRKMAIREFDRLISG